MFFLFIGGSFLFCMSDKHPKRDVTLNGNQSLGPMQKNSIYSLASQYIQE